MNLQASIVFLLSAAALARGEDPCIQVEDDLADCMGGQAESCKVCITMGMDAMSNATMGDAAYDDDMYGDDAYADDQPPNIRGGPSGPGGGPPGAPGGAGNPFMQMAEAVIEGCIEAEACSADCEAELDLSFQCAIMNSGPPANIPPTSIA